MSVDLGTVLNKINELIEIVCCFVNSNSNPEPPSSKISVFSGTTLIQGYDDVPSLQAFLDSYTLVDDTRVVFNTSDTFTLSAPFSITPTTAGHSLTLTNASGQTPTLDGATTIGTILQSGINDLTVDGLSLVNADASNLSGCIIRADGTQRNTFKNLTLKGGFCGVRATTNVVDLTLDSIVVDQCTNGAFRLGNGAASGVDVINTSITNVNFLDTLNGAPVQGISPTNLYLLVKKHNGLLVVNVNCGPFSIGTVETSSGVTISSCVADNFGHGVHTQGLYTTNCTSIQIVGNIIKSNSDGVSKVIYTSQSDSGLTLRENQFLIGNVGQDGSVYIEDVSSIEDISSNTFNGTNNSSQCVDLSFKPGSTLANDYKSEHDNVFDLLDIPVGGTLMAFLNLAELNSGGYQKIETVFGYTLAQYQSNLGRGQGSTFINH